MAKLLLRVQDERGWLEVVEDSGKVFMVIHALGLRVKREKTVVDLCLADNPLASSVVALLREAMLKEGRGIFHYDLTNLGELGR